MKQNIRLSNCFIFCAHKMVEHHPVEKHMVYGRPFEGTAFPAKLAEKACPVRSALKRPSINRRIFSSNRLCSTILWAQIMKQLETYFVSYVCMKQFLTSVPLLFLVKSMMCKMKQCMFTYRGVDLKYIIHFTSSNYLCSGTKREVCVQK